MNGILAGDRPIFLLHRSYQGGDDFGVLADAVSAAAGTRAELGVIVNLTYHTPADARAIFDSARGYGLRIADPEFHEHQAHGGTPSPTRLRHAGYLVGTLPGSPTDAIIDTVLDHQRDAGATVLLTPTGWVRDADAERSLRESMRWVTATRAKNPREPLIVGLTLSRSWLADARLREVLLNEVVDSIERNWYIRVRWNALRPAYGQLADQELLGGYAHLAQVMASENKVLLLPQTGLTGWLTSAFGAAGFSVGTGGPQQAFSARPEIRRSGTPRPPIPRYFEPSLFHTITAATRARLAGRSGYHPCRCGYCNGLTRGRAVTDPRRWNQQAARHLVVSLANLQAALPASGRRHEVRRIVTAARAVEGSIMPRLTGDERPLHLSVWEDLLR